MQLPSSLTLTWIGARLKELEEEACSIEEEEVRLAASGLEESERESQKRHLMFRAAKCFNEVRSIRHKLQDLCNHENKEMVGPHGSWYCHSCPKVHYEAPASRA